MFVSKNNKKIGWWIVLPAVLMVTVAIRVFVGEPGSVPSASMTPTILIGDWLWIDKTTYGARLPRRFADIPIINVFTWIKPLRLADAKNDWGHQRMKGKRMPRLGDLAVFESPEFPHHLLVKRITSKILTGDTITINLKNYPVMHKTVINEGNMIYVSNDTIFINGKPDSLCIVSQPYYFMLGDNRENSHDSREFGYVPYSSIVGRMSLALFSIDADKKFIDAVRWGRVLKRIR